MASEDLKEILLEFGYIEHGTQEDEVITDADIGKALIEEFIDDEDVLGDIVLAVLGDEEARARLEETLSDILEEIDRGEW